MAGLFITHDMLSQAYNLLLTTPPFRNWHMPLSDDISFHAVPMKGKTDADYCWLGDRHQIRINTKRHKSLGHLLESMAHEMIHLHQEHACDNDRGAHGSRFQRYAMSVCHHHLFDRGQF